VYAVIEDMPNQVATTGDISNELGCTIDSGRNKLKELRFEHKIKKRDAGGRSDLWYIPIEDEDDENGEESAEADETDDTDMAFKRLSREVDGPITTADGTVYEDGDKHSVGDAE
jgi:hypothetical protein